MIFADYHTHSRFSPDSSCPLERTLDAAIQQGITELCITDHIDYLTDMSRSTKLDFDGYYAEYIKQKQAYAGRIELKLGAEFGAQQHTVELFKRDAARLPFDFIILSNHEADDLEYWNGNFQEGKTQVEYNRAYYQATLETMKLFKDYSVLGHIDSIKRYDQNGELADGYSEDLIREILKTAISDGKGIEINTSCYRYRLKDLTPSSNILKWYRELGGEIITIGSDCHDSADVAADFKRAREELLALGFTRFCTFTAMKPEFHKL